MANQQPQTVSIDGTEYTIDDMTQEQRILLDHVVDLERKAASMDFQRQQIQIGRDAFFNMLKAALEKKPEVEEVN
jgi:hypothetical protein